MRPREITDADLAYWREHNPRVTRFTAPGEVEAGVEPCPAIVTESTDEFGAAARVAWQLDEVELARLRNGGTLWLSTWGGLPMHQLEVSEP